MGAWLASALEAAHELAAQRGQAVSTAHLLFGLWRVEPSIAALCERFGLRQRVLIPHLIFVDDRGWGVGEAIASAYKLAVAMSMRRTLPMHLLHAIALQPQCAANSALVCLGISAEALAQAALDALEVAPAFAPQAALAARASAVARPVRLPPAPAPRANVTVSSAAAAPAPRANAATRPAPSPRVNAFKRASGPPNASIWLGDEVEARLRRSDGPSAERAPFTFADQVEAKLRRGR